MSQLNVDEIYNQAATGGATAKTGFNVSGVCTATSFDGDGSALTGVANTDVVHTREITATGVVTFSNASVAESTTTGALRVTGGVGVGGSIYLGDSKGLVLGAGSDLQIVHDSGAGDSYITDAGTGALKLDASEIVLQHAQSAKIATTPTGAVVTGILTATTDLKVGTTIKAEAASGIVTATAFVPSAGQLSNRNIVINGAMQLAQRGTSSTTNGYETVDRFKLNSGSTGVTVTFSQQSATSSDTGPWENGFRNYARIALASAGTAGATTYAEYQQRIEAQNLATSGWDYTSSSSDITLSFWFRPSTNQTFYGYLYTYDGTAQGYAFSFTATGNNTWTKVTKTIPGNSSIQIDNNNGAGLQLLIIPFYGTDYTNNKTLDTWAAHAGSNYFPDMATTWLTTGTPLFDLTGVQLEVGSAATPFEHRSYADELLRCQRYFEVYYMNAGTGGLTGLQSNGTNHENSYQFKVQKRAQPTGALMGNASWATATPNLFTSPTECGFHNASSWFQLSDGSQDASLGFNAEL